jgi:hypothetical protein
MAGRDATCGDHLAQQQQQVTGGVLPPAHGTAPPAARPWHHRPHSAAGSTADRLRPASGGNCHPAAAACLRRAYARAVGDAVPGGACADCPGRPRAGCGARWPLTACAARARAATRRSAGGSSRGTHPGRARRRAGARWDCGGVMRRGRRSRAPVRRDHRRQGHVRDGAPDGPTGRARRRLPGVATHRPRPGRAPARGAAPGHSS